MRAARWSVGALAILGLWFLSLGGYAAELYVPSQYPTIQKAIDAANAGDTIYVAAGTYQEDAQTWVDIQVYKSVSIIGAGSGQTIVQLSNKQNGVEIRPDATGVVFIRGITFTKDPTQTYSAGFAIRLGETGGTFQSVTFSDVEVAYASGRNIHFDNATYNTISMVDCYIHHAGSWGCSIRGTVGTVTIRDCKFEYNGQVDASHGIGLDFENPTITNRVTVTDSRMNYNTAKGVNMTGVRNVTFKNVQFLGNSGAPFPAGGYGACLWEYTKGSQDVKFESCVLGQNGTDGLLIGVEGGNTVNGVEVIGCGLSNNPRGGLFIWNAGGTIQNISVRSALIARNGLWGVFTNTTSPVEAVDAACNWWGDPTGPYHLTLNPKGQGNPISDNVTLGTDNRQWWTTATGPCAYHYFLTMAEPSPDDGGTVDPAVGGPYPYPEGTGAQVTATPNPGFIFDEWQEWSNGQWMPIYGQATHTVTMDRDRTIRASFVRARHSLSVTVQPPGGGTVTVDPGPGPDGKHDYCTIVTLTPQPAAGYQFVRWEGTNANDVYQENGAWKIHINGDKSVTAVFNAVGPQPLFFEDFDDVTGWTQSGLWHTCTDSCFNCGKLSGIYAHYAKPGTCSYDTGARTTGILTSPVISIPKQATLTLQFDFARHVEYNTRVFRDQTSVQVRFGFVRVVGGVEYVIWTVWTPIWARSSRNPSPECGTFTYNFRTCSYERMQIRFVFDSVDRFANNFPGWAIDNVVIKPPATAPAALEVTDIGPGWEAAMQPGKLAVVNTPNPVRDVHTTTFTVLGVEAEAVRVEVYDLTGRLVWKAETPGNELVWHTEDFTGLPLANGVYLYVTHVKVGGSWVKLDPQKLVILR